MADSPVFTQTCNELGEKTSFSAIEARGTVRLALKSAGLDAANVTVEQMGVVLEKVLPNELMTRGIDDAPTVCSSIRSGLDSVDLSAVVADTPDAIFARLGASAN